MTTAILILHILTGFLALGTAGAAIGTAKGGLWHRRAGNIYVLSMLAVTLTTFALVAIRPNLFLFVIGIFSFYLVFTGWRAAMLRDGQPRWPDHLGGLAMAATGLVMMGLGLNGLAGAGGAQPVILLVFGSIGLSLALSDWRDWRAGPVTGKARIARHLTRMLAGTIATITAAVVVNITFLPALVTWLGPTALITPVIFWWNARVMRGAAPA
ncbi:hypothetical protein HUK65_15980 [Rhodobacteraceae bacterium 2376]|uniref:Uncharacterized protein n=1 Tax=Rhabdonatronobacter sediminivivens TaxID=2743469 RepID=A0A7Z0I1Z4_9RHOB|nr:hypothetical protein [Rhabdonatronobacter sediminivivens]NYS26484.1 hypothetical protein [Rhabdonatronobacter sediminivivens]